MNILFSFATYGLSTYDWYFAAGLTTVIDQLLAPATAAAAVAPRPGRPVAASALVPSLRAVKVNS
jgi:hypothetical protein